MNKFELLNGAYEATFEKGKWSYVPTFKPFEKKVDKGSEKEKPQYSFIAKAEKETANRFNITLTKTVIDVVKYLKQCNSQSNR